MAHHARHVDFALTQKRRNWLRGTSRYFEQIRVERDDTGSVTGLRISSNRVRNLLFVKE